MIVECINSNGIPPYLTKPPKQGSFYTVTQVVNGARGKGYILDECFELTRAGNPVSYHESRFVNVEEIEISELLTNIITI